MTQEEFLQQSFVPANFYKEWYATPDKAKFWELNRDKLEEYPGFKKVDEEFTPLKQRLLKSIGEKKNWDEASVSFRKETADELNTTIEELDNAWTELKKDKEYAQGVKERTEEVKNWPWYKKMLASEYSKERYIKDPESSIFSDKGKWYNKGDDVSDVIFGAAGTVGDVIPGIGIVAGPAARAARDVYHKQTNSPYQKEWNEIASDVGSDIAFNASTELLPTAILRRGNRVARNASKNSEGVFKQKLKDAEKYMEAKESQKTIDKSVETFKKNENTWNDPVEFKRQVDNLPEGPMKRDLDAVATNPDATSEDRFNAFVDWKLQSLNAKGDKPVYQNGIMVERTKEFRPAVQQAEMQRAFGLKPIDNTTKLMVYGADAWKHGGESAVKAGKTATGRGSKAKETEDAKIARWKKGFATTEERKSDEYNDWYKQNLKIMMGVED